MFKTVIVNKDCNLNSGLIAGKSFADYICSVIPSSAVLSSDELENASLKDDYIFLLPSPAVCMNNDFAEEAVTFHKNSGYDLTYIKSSDENNDFFAYVINNCVFKQTVKNGFDNITDTALKNNLKIGIYAKSCEELTYVNSPKAYSKACSVIRNRINDLHMDNGVVFIDPNHTYIDADVIIGSGTVIYPNVYITGSSKIGSDCIISQNSIITNRIINNGEII